MHHCGLPRLASQQIQVALDQNTKHTYHGQLRWRWTPAYVQKISVLTDKCTPIFVRTSMLAYFLQLTLNTVTDLDKELEASAKV